MQLSQEAIEEFKAIYKEEYGQDISDAEAQKIGSRLLRLFMVLLETDAEPSTTSLSIPDNSNNEPDCMQA